jgi:DcuC family C4-dicarboxylate transporter
MSRGGDLGMMIMMLCGFATYMTHIGANDMVVKLASKPLQYINSRQGRRKSPPRRRG